MLSDKMTIASIILENTDDRTVTLHELICAYSTHCRQTTNAHLIRVAMLLCTLGMSFRPHLTIVTSDGLTRNTVLL